MKNYRLLASVAVLAGAACSDATAGRQTLLSAASLSGALSTVPAGYGDLTSSFVGGTAAAAGDSVWVGGGREHHGPGRGDLMGGGMDAAFLGGVDMGGGHGHRGPFGGGLACTGSFSAASNRFICDPQTLHNGLTVARSAQYKDAGGTVQQAFDTLTTNTVNIQSDVTGTLTFAAPDDSGAVQGRPGGPGGPGGRGGRGGPGGGPCWGDGRGPGGLLLGDTAHIVSATTTVHNVSDRTVSGLASGSAQRTANGTSAGQESTTGTSTRGDFTATRVVGDTTTGLVIPVSASGPSYPTAGTVVRSMTATLTYAGQTPVQLSRREVVTYDGSATAQITITENGTTKSCTRALPRGQLVCQ